jgi:hypothetical protein
MAIVKLLRDGRVILPVEVLQPCGLPRGHYCTQRYAMVR